MKRIMELRNRKLSFLLIIYIIFNILKSIFFIQIKYGSYYYSILFIIIYVVLLIILLNKLIIKYKIDDEKIIEGLLFRQIIIWDNIDKIVFNPNIEIIIYSTKKSLKYSLELSGISIEKKNELTENIKCEAKKRGILYHVDEKKQDSPSGKDDHQGIKGGLLFLFLVIIFYLLADLIQIFNSFFDLIISDNIIYSVINFTILLFVVLMGIYVLIIFSKKKKKTVKTIKIYRYIYIFKSIVIEYTAIYLKENMGIINNIAPILIRILATILMTLIINEYLNVSVRVKHTFIK